MIAIKPDWATLDVYSEITQFLSPDEVARNERVCRAWRAFSDTSVWKQQYQQERATTAPNIPQELVSTLDTLYQEGFLKVKIPLGVYRIISEYVEKTPEDSGFYKRAFSHPYPNILSLTAKEWEMDGVRVNDTPLPWHIHRKIASKPFPCALLLIPQMVNGKYFAAPGHKFQSNVVAKASRGMETLCLLNLSVGLQEEMLDNETEIQVDKSYYVILTQQVDPPSASEDPFTQRYGKRCRSPTALELLIGVVAANVVLGRPLCDDRGQSLTGDTNLWSIAHSKDVIANSSGYHFFGETLAVGCTYSSQNFENFHIHMAMPRALYPNGIEFIGFRGAFDVEDKKERLSRANTKSCFIL